MSKPTLDIYKARDGWRWRLVAANGNILADSGEAYTRRASAALGCMRAVRAMCVATVTLLQGVGK